MSLFHCLLELSSPPVNHHFQVPQTNTAAGGAADWSKIAFDDELNTIFNQEEKTNEIPTRNLEPPSTLHHSVEQPPPPPTPSSSSASGKLKLLHIEIKSSFFVVFSAYPSWCSQPPVFFPLVYQQVFEASCISNVIQTSVLYPILILSGLRQDQLSQIWSQVNLTEPGILIKEELFMALALIALAQNSNGQIFSNHHLYHLTDIPVPHFQIQQEPSPPAVTVPPPPPVPVTPVYQQEDFADFTSFDHIVENTTTTNDGGTLLDFDENFLYPPDIKTTSSETQSLASLDLPIPTINPINQDDNSQKGISDNISFTSSNNNDIIPIADTQSLHSITSSEPSKLGKYHWKSKI